MKRLVIGVAIFAVAVLVYATVLRPKLRDFGAIGVDAGWIITKRPVGNEGEPQLCSAILRGDPIMTIIMVNAYNKVILSGYNDKWAIPPAQKDITLSIDSSPAENLLVGGINDRVMVAIPEDAIESRLDRATSILWHFPDSEYRVPVHDISRAAAGVRECEKNRPKT